jgi:fatty-acyl-CoA synthase
MPLLDPGAGLAHWAPEHGAPLIEGSIGDVLRRNAARWGDRPALIWSGEAGVERMDYAQLLARAERGSRWLLERMEPGDRLAGWSSSRVEYAVLLYACALAGVIATPYNPGWSDAEARHAVALTQPKLIFTGLDGRRIPLRERALAGLSCPVHDLSEVMSLRPADDARPLPALGPSDPYLIQFTSGTTGRAKGALLSHRAALMGGAQALDVAAPDETDIWLSPAPFHHIGGSVSMLLGVLVAGGANTIVERFDANTVVSLVRAVRPTRMGAVPTIYFDVLRHPDMQEDFKIRIAGVGGASVPAVLVRELEARTGGAVSIVYGLSECPAVTITSPDDDVVIKTETVGRPVAHMAVKIADPVTGETLACGEVGEICVRGPSVMDGYWGDPQASAAAFDAEGFLRTGDLASMAPDGVCRIQGRAKEMIIRGGENIYPAEVEGALMRHPAVDTAAVVGVPHERLGQQVAAVIKLRDGAQAGAEALAAYTAGLVSYFKVPTRWLFVEALPMTATGKVRKIELPALFDAE